MGASSRWWVLFALASPSCAPDVDAVGPVPSMRLLDPELMLRELQGQLHLRVFPKGSLQCDGYNTPNRDSAVGRYVVTAAGQRVLDTLPGGGLTPMARCTQGSTGMRASPVDECVASAMPRRLELPAGTYIVLVHGHGDIPLPDGTTQAGIRGSGCAVVTVRAGDQRSITVPIHGVRPAGVCGNGVVDFDETCDAPNDPACMMCQTVERVANRVVEGNQRHPAAVWGPSQRLVVGYDVSDNNTTGEDVYAQYFQPDASQETGGRLAADQRLGTGPSVQQYPRFATTGGAMGTRFVAVWETLEQNPQNAAAQVFDDAAPVNMRVFVGPMGTRRQRPAVAASNNRVVAVWAEAGGIRAASAALAMNLAGDLTGAMSVSDGAAEDPKVAALTDGSFAVVWSAMGDVWARRLSAAGAPMGTATRVNMVTAGTQEHPAVAALPNGEAAVAWRDANMSGQARATIRWTRLTGAALAPSNMGTVLSSTTVASDPSRPFLALGTGASAGSAPAVLAVWEDAVSGRIHGRLRRSDDAEFANRVSGSTADFAISAEGGAARHDPVAAFSGADTKRFVVAWQGTDGMGDGIVMRVFPQ